MQSWNKHFYSCVEKIGKLLDQVAKLWNKLEKFGTDRKILEQIVVSLHVYLVQTIS